ncbi:MAG: deoxyribonuclease [Actinomycetaceae bacterium]|nr:deoxyribonuclease [Actinomycetaceae bacterium]MDY6083440.1 deoxyribonuclease [Actinomycetaceae bacterium]
MREIMRTLQSAVPDVGRWWPGESRFEILVGAILTQNTAWTNVQMALQNLRSASLLDADRLLRASEDVVQQAIRPSGYWRTKTRYVKALAQWFIRYDADVAQWDDDELRASLLAVRGVGEETADDILLYAYRRGVFIFDAYGRRLLNAAGWGNYSTYSQARHACWATIREEAFSVDEYALLHGLIVQAGKEARAAGGWDVYWPAALQHAAI